MVFYNPFAERAELLKLPDKGIFKLFFSLQSVPVQTAFRPNIRT